MRYAQVKNNLVVNVVIGEGLTSTQGFIASDTANIGDWYSVGTFTAPPPVITGEPAIVAEVLPQIPLEVSNIQAYEAIRHFELLPAVKAYMADLDEDDLIRVTWEKATVFKRTSPTLLAIADELELTSSDLDAMFAYAATVEV